MQYETKLKHKENLRKRMQRNMSKLIKIVACVALLLGVACSGHCNEWRKLNTRVEKSGLDTPLHIGAGIIGTSLTYHALPNDMNPFIRKGIAFAVPVLLGTIKEATDKNFDMGDIGGYALGSGLAVTVISISF